ncbi:hypothetical protein GCM10009712_44920 [Pseudarthrobacter sulfonivorans]
MSAWAGAAIAAEPPSRLNERAGTKAILALIERVFIVGLLDIFAPIKDAKHHFLDSTKADATEHVVIGATGYVAFDQCGGSSLPVPFSNSTPRLSGGLTPDSL